MIRHTLAAMAVAATVLAPQAVPAQSNATVLTYVGTIGENTRMGTQTFTITASGKPDSYTVQGKVDLDFKIKVLLMNYHVINQSNYTESWEAAKLKSFKGQTRDRDDNYVIEMINQGGKVQVSATKNKDKPVVRDVSPDIAPASFWLEGWFMRVPRPQYISTNSGKVKPAKAPKLEGQQQVNYKGSSVKVNYYTMDFDGEKYEFWYFADTGLLYKRAEPSEGGKVVFTLQ